MEWVPLPLRRYVTRSGRSRRKEFWTFILLLTIVRCAMAIVADFAGSHSDPFYGLLSFIVDLATFFLLIVFGVRRLHDTDRSGWWLLAPLAAAMPGAALMDDDFTRGTIVAIVGESSVLPPSFFSCVGMGRTGPIASAPTRRDGIAGLLT